MEPRNDTMFSVHAEKVFDIIHYPEIKHKRELFYVHHYYTLQQRVYARQAF